MPSWFDNAQIDARGSSFTNITGDQINYVDSRGARPRPGGNTYNYGARPGAPPSSSSPSWADDPPSFMQDHPDPPSWTAGHPDPPSWAAGHPDPPFWAKQRNNGTTSNNSSQRTARQLPSSSRFTTIADTSRAPPAGRSSLQSSRSSTLSSTSSVPSAERSSLQSSGFSPPDIFPNFPHTLELTESDPKLKLDDLLSRFETDISPWKDPSNWLHAEADDLDNILSKLSEKRGETQEYAEAAFPVDGMMVYTRSIVYIYIHLGHCRAELADDKPFNAFKKKLHEWRQWDSVQILQNSRAMEDYLVNLFRTYLQLPVHVLQRLQNEHPKGEPKAQYHLEATLKSIMNIDAIRLAACVSVAVADREMNKEILGLQGEAAQSILDLLQARLDVYVEPSLKARHRKTLIKLAKETRLYPKSLLLHDIEIEPEVVASGGFGEVHKGTLKHRAVAVKMLKLFTKTDMGKLLKDFSAEAVIWRQLSHPNVLHFYGVYEIKGKHASRLCFVCPWMENGNMQSYLAEEENKYAPRVPLMQDVAEGLKYLHGENIVHGDLKGLNILISHAGRACLADFGLTAIRDSSLEMMSHFNSATRGSTGTLRWQAPELFDVDGDEESTSNTKATDIYAFAMVCWEMFYGIPWPDKRNDMQVINAVGRGQRPERPNLNPPPPNPNPPPPNDGNNNRNKGLAIPDDVWKIIVSCWHQRPENRPTATEVVENLRALPDGRTYSPFFDDQDLISSTQVFKETYHPFSSLFSVVDAMESSTLLSDISDTSDIESMSTGA